MLPKARSRSARRRWSLFGRRGNRRVRTATPPALPRPPRPPLWTRAWAALVAWRRSFLVAAVGMALAAGAWGGRWYLTHSRHFALATVRVSPTVHVAAAALVARAAVPLGVNLFAVDRDEVARAVSQEPWVERVHVRRELPSTLVIDVVERAGRLRGRARLGLPRRRRRQRLQARHARRGGGPAGGDRHRARRLRGAARARARPSSPRRCAPIAAWRARGDGSARPPLGEVHVDRIAGVTLYTDGGVGVRLGLVDDTLPARLGRYDAVAAALSRGRRGGRASSTSTTARDPIA